MNGPTSDAEDVVISAQRKSPRRWPNVSVFTVSVFGGLVVCLVFFWRNPLHLIAARWLWIPVLLVAVLVAARVVMLRAEPASRAIVGFLTAFALLVLEPSSSATHHSANEKLTIALNGRG